LQTCLYWKSWSLVLPWRGIVLEEEEQEQEQVQEQVLVSVAVPKRLEQGEM
jgi:hypothetical protein